MATSNSSRDRGWVGIALACLVILGIIFITLPTLMGSRRITITVGANGQAQLYGVSLGRGKFRQVVFWGLLRGTRADVRLEVSPKTNFTNATEVLKAMSKISYRNRPPPPPNPYE